MKRHRVALSLALSAAMVLAIAILLPRAYIANDDIGLTEYLRKHVFTSWMSPILVQALGFAYQAELRVPWYGLYMYGLIVATGAVLIHTCTELIDHRPGLGRIVTVLGAVVIGATHSIIAIRLTWTAVSISALGTATAAFVAHALQCQAEGKPMSRLRSLVLGLVFVGGYMLRREGLAAMVVALLPFLGWAALRFARARRMPPLGALIAVVAPFALVVAIQHRIPQARGADFEEYNTERGKLHGQAAFEQLDQRAPEVLERAGWTPQEYRDFSGWLVIDEHDFTLEKIKRLVDTGGMPEQVTLSWSYRQLRSVFDESALSVLLFVIMVVAVVMLAWLGAIARWRGLLFSLGYFAYLVAVPVWMAAHYRFPQRVALAFYAVAALAVFVYLARQIADRPAVHDLRVTRDPRLVVAAAVIAALLLSWTRHLRISLESQPSPYRDAIQALENRVAARKGFVFIFVQAGLVELDPLRAEPRSYDGLQGGWGTFSIAWYDTIERLGVHRGSEVFGALIDNPEGYVLAWPAVRTILEDWIRRKVHDQSVRLAFVDGAAILGEGRPVLYRLVTKPMQRGDAEWSALARDERAMHEIFPGPPSVADLAFRSIAFAAPYEQHLAQTGDPGTRIVAFPADGALRCTTAEPQTGDCAPTVERHAGVHIPVNGLRAARFELTLIDPQNIVSVNVYARTETSRMIRWFWGLTPQTQQFGFTGTFTLVPGYSAHRLQLAVNAARLRDIRDLDIFITTKPGTQAGFELRHLEVAEP